MLILTNHARSYRPHPLLSKIYTFDLLEKAYLAVFLKQVIYDIKKILKCKNKRSRDQSWFVTVTFYT